MPYNAPPTFVDGDPLPAADLNVLGDDIEYLYGVSQGVTASGVQVSRSSNQAVSSGSHAYVSFEAEAFDFGGWWSSGTTITVPAGAIPAGFTTILLQVAVNAKFASNGTGIRRIEVHKNGASFGSWQVSAISGDQTDLILPEWTTVAAGDTIKLDVYQTSGSSLNLTEARMTVMRVAPAA
jgi:hypothetical protein